MKQVITAKLKLHTDKTQFQALRTTQLAYRDALNFVSQYAYGHGKSSNRVFLQDGTYADVRARFNLPSQMACSVPRQVGATYKTLWTKVKQNAAQRKAGMTKKRYKGLDRPPKFISPTLTYPRDAHQCVYLSTPWEEGAAGESAHPCELEAWERLLKCPFQPGAWNKRSREQRPLTGVGKLAERERAGDGNALQCRTPLALGKERPPTPVKGGIAHATG